jgi:hypothetical protein
MMALAGSVGHRPTVGASLAPNRSAAVLLEAAIHRERARDTARVVAGADRDALLRRPVDGGSEFRVMGP